MYSNILKTAEETKLYSLKKDERDLKELLSFLTWKINSESEDGMFFLKIENTPLYNKNISEDCFNQIKKLGYKVETEGNGLIISWE